MDGMTSAQTPGAVKRFRTTSWTFQQTFATPLKNLRPFAQSIVGALERFQAAQLTIDQVVFEPRHLVDLMRAHSLPIDYAHDRTLSAASRQEAELLLESTLSDWIDFVFIPTPRQFVIYADHDEYTTFFANRKRNVNRVAEALLARGFRRVPHYVRSPRKAHPAANTN